MPRETSRQRYCICRKTNSTGSMVQCERCKEWFHFKCIGMTEETAPGDDEDWFCDACLKTGKQCLNPPCVTEARKGSKYCSDECGLEYNKTRYLKHFVPKWERLEKEHSAAYKAKMLERQELEDKKDALIELIGNLKREREELAQKILDIKEHAKALGSEATQAKDQDMGDSGDEDEEDTISSDQTKTFCVICGVEQQADKAFKHWTSCFKKQEAGFVSYLPPDYKDLSCPTDPNPGLHCCQIVDKKFNLRCSNLKTLCLQHSNWSIGEGEICACPLSIVQELERNGNYCLKPKKDCTTHFHWDKFRLGTKDYERLQAFHRLMNIQEEIARTQSSLHDTYGGVLGVMLHNTIDHKLKEDFDEPMIDMN